MRQIRTLTLKELQAYYAIDLETAKVMRGLMILLKENEDLKSHQICDFIDLYANQNPNHFKPFINNDQYRNIRSVKYLAMLALDCLLGGSGVEYLQFKNKKDNELDKASYVNLGDPYTTTVIRYDDKFLCCDYGGFLDQKASSYE